jgi:hypothetical protein
VSISVEENWDILTRACSAVMKSFFDSCVDKIVELIKGHVGRIERPPVKSRVRVSLKYAAVGGELTSLRACS